MAVHPLRTALLGSALVVGGAVATLSAYAKARSFQGPGFLARYLMTPHSRAGDLFARRPIRRAAVPIEFPRDVRPIEQLVPWKGNWRGLTGVLADTHTNAFLVARDGVIVHEWCREGWDTATPHSSWSVAKSVVGLLTGQLIAEGTLTEETRLTEVLPEYKTGGPFDTITVGHLLDMRSGIDLAEEYKEWEAYTGVGGLMTTLDIPAYLARNRHTFAVPGTITDYRSVDSQYLSMIVARVEGEPLADVVQRRIWEPLGALDTAFWSLDRDGGIEKGFMALNATARDFLKIGQLVLDRGRVGAQQVVPETWIDRMSTPAGIVQSDSHAWGYAAKWWQPEGWDEHGDLTALGVYGQYVYVNPASRVVIVKLSDHGTEQDEDETIAVFRHLSKELSRAAS